MPRNRRRSSIPRESGKGWLRSFIERQDRRWRKISNQNERRHQVYVEVVSHMIDRLPLTPQKKDWLKKHEAVTSLIGVKLAELNRDIFPSAGEMLLILRSALNDAAIIVGGKNKSEMQGSFVQSFRNDISHLKTVDPKEKVLVDLKLLTGLMNMNQGAARKEIGELYSKFMYRKFKVLTYIAEMHKPGEN